MHCPRRQEGGWGAQGSQVDRRRPERVGGIPRQVRACVTATISVRPQLRLEADTGLDTVLGPRWRWQWREQRAEAVAAHTRIGFGSRPGLQQRGRGPGMTASPAGQNCGSLRGSGIRSVRASRRGVSAPVGTDWRCCRDNSGGCGGMILEASSARSHPSILP